MIFSKISGQVYAKTMLSGAIKNGMVANAYLFTGPAGSGKREMAIEFIKELNCTCGGMGSCLNCKKIIKNVHPDLLIIEPDGSAIKIDQIRCLKKAAQYGPSEGKLFGIIIDPADAMTTEAANSFLKLLEEPTAGITFILITSKEKSMFHTIISRCQKIFFVPSQDFDIEEDLLTVFDNFKTIKGKSPTQLLEIAEEISHLGNTKEVEKVLLSMAYWFRQNLSGFKSLKAIHAIMDAQRKISCRTNVRLTLESMNLAIGDIYA